MLKKNTLLCFRLGVLSLFALQSVSIAADIYVSVNTGSDSNPGTEASPYKTLDKAEQEADPGETVFIMAGTYNEGLEIDCGSTGGTYVTFEAYGDGEVIIEPGETYDTWVDGSSTDIYELDLSGVSGIIDGELRIIRKED